MEGEPQKKVIFVLAVPLRGGGKDRAIKGKKSQRLLSSEGANKKITFSSGFPIQHTSNFFLASEFQKPGCITVWKGWNFILLPAILGTLLKLKRYNFDYLDFTEKLFQILGRHSSNQS